MTVHPPLEVVVLAAGKGTRMRSDLPKVLHTLAGRPLLAHVLDTVHALGARAVHVVYGHGGERVPQAFPDAGAQWVLQDQQLGTGHAVSMAMPGVPDDATVLVVYGDVPLIRAGTLSALVDAAEDAPLALLTVELDEPAAYGRIVREQDEVSRIVEYKDADEATRAIREINTGFLAARAGNLRRWLAKLDSNNAQGEFYLTDVVALAVAEGISVATENPATVSEIEGINSKVELARLERQYQMNKAQELMEQGVILRDPARFDLRGELVAGRDVVIDVNVIIEGKVELGDGVHIGPNSIVRDTVIGAGSQVLANCVIEDSRIGAGCSIGPFARLRPGTELADRAKAGNFVEIKNSQIAEGSKINHLTYIGDTAMGSGVNIGAGTITANYDGANKHRTVIGDKASIGANSVLVAPVTVGVGATLGAGTMLRKDAPEGTLTISENRQKTIEGWKRPVKNKT
jgi:bifunctional UDP-N-acetylglucosamine pyrophosphorylase/glucosamine-1-phosphate N-acetyltransferase